MASVIGDRNDGGKADPEDRADGSMRSSDGSREREEILEQSQFDDLPSEPGRPLPGDTPTDTGTDTDEGPVTPEHTARVLDQQQFDLPGDDPAGD